MDLQLSDKRMLVTGSSAGIAEAIARKLATDGATVAVYGRDWDRINRIMLEIRLAGGAAVAVLDDLTNDDDVKRLTAHAERLLGALIFLLTTRVGLVKNTFGRTPNPRVARSL